MITDVLVMALLAGVLVLTMPRTGDVSLVCKAASAVGKAAVACVAAIVLYTVVLIAGAAIEGATAPSPATAYPTRPEVSI